MLIDVADHGAVEKVGLAEQLEPVADPQHWQPLVRGIDDGFHHGAEPRDGPAPQVVTVGETARENDGIHPIDGVRAVPQRDGLGTAQLHGAQRVVVVEGPREGDHADAGHQSVTTS